MVFRRQLHDIHVALELKIRYIDRNENRNLCSKKKDAQTKYLSPQSHTST